MGSTPFPPSPLPLPPTLAPLQPATAFFCSCHEDQVASAAGSKAEAEVEDAGATPPPPPLPWHRRQHHGLALLRWWYGQAAQVFPIPNQRRGWASTTCVLAPLEGGRSPQPTHRCHCQRSESTRGEARAGAASHACRLAGTPGPYGRTAPGPRRRRRSPAQAGCAKRRRGGVGGGGGPLAAGGSGGGGGGGLGYAGGDPAPTPRRGNRPRKPPRRGGPDGG